jgi:hypothetical protein
MIIGFAGPAGVGKDTAAHYLVQNYGFRQMAFAATLKEMLAIAGLPEPANRDDKEKVIPGFDFSWRQAAQMLGTEWGRALDPDIWIKLTEQKLRNPFNNFTFSDVRFENEAAMLRRRGVVVHLRGRAADLGAAAAHASETGVLALGGDHIIHNDGSVGELHLELDGLMSRLMEPLS